MNEVRIALRNVGRIDPMSIEDYIAAGGYEALKKARTLDRGELITTIEVDYLMFGRSVHPKSYILAAVLTFVFSLSVNFFSFFTIRKIDMIESLKSVE